MFQKILTDEIIASSESCLCESCWENLDNFHNFSSMVEANYQSQELIEETNEDQIDGLDSEELKDPTHVIIKEYPPEPDLIDNEITMRTDEDIAEVQWIEVEEVEDHKQTTKNYSDVYGVVQKEINEDDKKIQAHAEMNCDICRNYKFKK
jgi:hypothetical protein